MKLKELLSIYWRQNIGPFLLGLVVALCIPRLCSRLFCWDARLVYVALLIFAALELYKFVRFLLDCRD